MLAYTFCWLVVQQAKHSSFAHSSYAVPCFMNVLHSIVIIL